MFSIDATSSGQTVGLAHFGTNYLADRQRLDQTIEGNNGFGLASSSMGNTLLRYPGGSLTEEYFDLSDARHFQRNGETTVFVSAFDDPEKNTELTKLSEFMDYAIDNDNQVTVVIPTIRYYSMISSNDITDIQNLKSTVQTFIARTLGDRSADSIHAFEIGNEFPSWAKELFQDAADFALFTRNFPVWIKETIDEFGRDDVKVFAQGPFVKYGTYGNNIQLDAF